MNGFSGIEDEIRRRIQRDHNFDIRNEMNKFSSEELKFETLSPRDIFKSLQQFIVETYIPGTLDLRNELHLKLTLHERELIKLERAKCNLILQSKFDENINELSGQERELKQLLANIELLNPSPITIKNNGPEFFNKVYEISKRINSIPEAHVKSFNELKREKIKIRLGKLGNLISSAVGFRGSNINDQNDIIELLIIK